MVNVTDWLQSKSDAEQDNSVQGSGSQVAPTTTTDVATVTIVKAGMYEITFSAGYGAVADTIDNLKLVIVGVGNILGAVPMLPVVNGNRIPLTVKQRLTAGQVVSLRPVANGAATTVYVGTIIAKRISG